MEILPLYGGELSWSPLDWTSLDDTVRGGNSFSNFICDPSNPIATFSGNLDIKTLGNAGFASQHTTGDDLGLNLSNYEGILLDIKLSDGKIYTFSLMDQPSPSGPNGEVQSRISWDYDFIANKFGDQQNIYWSDFKPYYRGREVSDTEPLNLKRIFRLSIMIRSFFGSQDGDFSISISSIHAFRNNGEKLSYDSSDDGSNGKMNFVEKNAMMEPLPRRLLGRIFGSCLRR